MDRQYIADRHVVARYLADQLSDAERGEFEAFCAENPEVWREIEATARLKVGLAKLAETGELEGALAKPQGFGAFAMRHAAGFGAIGVGIAVLIGTVYVMRVPAMGSSIAEVSGRFRSDLPVSTAVYDFMQMRSGEANTDIAKEVSLPSAPKALHFRVAPQAKSKPPYRAVLRQISDSGSRMIAQVDGLELDDGHFVSFFVNSAALVSGMYVLTVEPEDLRSSEQKSEYRLQVRSEN